MKKTRDFWKDCRVLLRGIHRENRKTIPLVITGAMLEAAPPFVSMIFGARILDKMIGGFGRGEIMREVYLMAGLSLVIVLLSRWFAKLYRISAVEMEGRTTATLACKCLTMDFAQLETQEIMALKQRADAGKNAGGGLFYFCFIGAKLCGGIFSGIYALTALGVLFVPAPAQGLTSWQRVLNSPLAAVFLLAATVLTTLLGFPLLRKANQVDYDIFNANAEGQRRRMAYLDMGDYRLGKDIRTYGFGSLL